MTGVTLWFFSGPIKPESLKYVAVIVIFFNSGMSLKTEVSLRLFDAAQDWEGGFSFADTVACVVLPWQQLKRDVQIPVKTVLCCHQGDYHLKIIGTVVTKVWWGRGDDHV